MTTIATTYSSKSTAVRGARRAGYEEDAYIVVQNAEGRWEVLVTNRDDTTVEEIEEAIAEEVADKAKAPAYKVLARQSAPKSTIEKPVDFVHAFLNEHLELTRKEAVAKLVALGVNFSTARTQYQKWFSARKG